MLHIKPFISGFIIIHQIVILSRMLNDQIKYQPNLKLIAIYSLLSGFSIVVNITLIILYQFHHISPQNFTNNLFESVNSQLLQNNSYMQYKYYYHKSYVKVTFIMLFLSIFSQICNLFAVYFHIKLKKNQQNQQRNKIQIQITIKVCICFILLSLLWGCNYFSYILSFYNDFRLQNIVYISLDAYRNIFLPNIVLKIFQIVTIILNVFIVCYLNKKSDIYNVAEAINLLDGDPLYDQVQNPLKKFNNNLRIISNGKHNQSLHNSFHNQSMLSKDESKDIGEQKNSKFRILLNNKNVIANIQINNQANQYFQSEIIQYQKNQNKKIHQFINFFDDKNTDRTLKYFCQQISKLQVSIYKPELDNTQWNQKKAPFMILEQLNSSTSQNQSEIERQKNSIKQKAKIQTQKQKQKVQSNGSIVTKKSGSTIDRRTIPRLPIRQILQRQKLMQKESKNNIKLDIKKINHVKPLRTIQSFDNPNIELLNKHRIFKIDQQQFSVQDF